MRNRATVITNKVCDDSLAIRGVPAVINAQETADINRTRSPPIL